MSRAQRLVAAALLTATLMTGCGDDDDTPGAVAGAEAPAVKLSANRATEEELQTIPGVGPEIAEEIIEYRPYDAETGPARFRQEMGKYLADEDVENLMTYLTFD